MIKQLTKKEEFDYLYKNLIVEMLLQRDVKPNDIAVARYFNRIIPDIVRKMNRSLDSN